MRGGWLRRIELGLTLAIVSAGCASASTTISLAPGSGSPSVSTPAGSELDKLRARGTLVVAIRVEAPPPNRSVGGDRLAALDQGTDIAMTVDTPAGRDRAQLSAPYAANAIVLAAKSGGPVKALEDIRGGTVAVAMDELGARDVAQAYLQERGIAATIDTYMGVSGAATAVEAGKAGALIGDKVGVAVIAADRSFSIVAVIAQRPYVIAVRKGAPDVATAISDALRAALDSGAIAAAAAKASFPYEAP